MVFFPGCHDCLRAKPFGARKLPCEDVVDRGDVPMSVLSGDGDLEMGIGAEPDDVVLTGKRIPRGGTFEDVSCKTPLT